MNHQEKLSYVARLVEIAKADGGIDPAEAKIIKQVSVSLGLSKADLSVIAGMTEGFLGLDDLPIPDSDESRLLLFQQAVAIVRADGVIYEAEASMIDCLASTLGLDPKIVDEYIDEDEVVFEDLPESKHTGIGGSGLFDDSGAKLIRFKDTSTQCWARIDLKNSDPIWISVAKNVLVKKSRIGIAGAVLFDSSDQGLLMRMSEIIHNQTQVWLIPTGMLRTQLRCFAQVALETSAANELKNRLQAICEEAAC